MEGPEIPLLQFAGCCFCVGTAPEDLNGSSSGRLMGIRHGPDYQSGSVYLDRNRDFLNQLGLDPYCLAKCAVI